MGVEKIPLIHSNPIYIYIYIWWVAVLNDLVQQFLGKKNTATCVQLVVWDLQLGVHWCPQESRCQPLETENWANNYPLVNIQKNIQKKTSENSMFRELIRFTDLPKKSEWRDDIKRSTLTRGYIQGSNHGTMLQGWCPTVEPEQSPGSNQYLPGDENPTTSWWRIKLSMCHDN